MSPEPLLPESSPLPKLHEFMPAVLSYLSDGSVRTSKEIRSAVAEALGLSQGSWRLSYLPGDLYMQTVRIGPISTLSSGEL